MLYLVLSITCSTSILVLFKFLGKRQVNTFNVIIINYFTAAILGWILSYVTLKELLSRPDTWMFFALFIGIAFVVMFHVIGLTTQKLGIMVSSVAGRMSLVIPVMFSIIYENESLGVLKVIGVFMALLAVLMLVYNKDKHQIDRRYILLPFILFLGLGILDSTIKFSQSKFIGDVDLAAFSTFLFSVSAVSALSFRIIKPVSNEVFTFGTIWPGILLGMVNFGSLFFFIRALAHGNLVSSAVFGINHVGIVMLSVLAALVLFREKLNRYNWAGIILAVITIIILSFSG